MVEGDTIKFLELLNEANQKTIRAQQDEILFLKEQNKQLLDRIIGVNKIRESIEEHDPIGGIHPLRARIRNAEQKSREEYNRLNNANEERETVSADASGGS